MTLTHEKRGRSAGTAPLAERNNRRTTNPVKSNNTRSDREIVAIFDAAVYRALLAKQREVLTFLAGGGRRAQSR